VPCRNPFHSKDDELEQAVEDAKHDDENWMRDLRAECARANRAEAERDRFEHLYQATNNAYGDKNMEAKGYKAELEALEQQHKQAVAGLTEIANRPTSERNPDGDEQAAHTMQLIARETLEALASPPEGEKDG
jgi:hypothetical protein